MPDPVDELVPDSVIPHQTLPPLRYRDLPEAPPWRQMVGPSIILAGLALGSGEFIFWPYITYKSGFVFFWACMLGVLTQFFVNMEIERWTLATGESAITGFCRLSRHWAWVFLILNFVPWIWPGWATGAGQMISWTVFGKQAPYVEPIAIATLVGVGIVLTSGPVVYNTVEKLQTWLVGSIFVTALVLGALFIRGEAVIEMLKGIGSVGSLPPESAGLSLMSLLGALAFAGAGGSMNLGQSNFIKDKGYGMGKYIGRITSPVTGNEEAIADVGYHFKHTPENLARWREWWKAANLEHFFSFYLTCVVCLVLLSLLAYSLIHDPAGGIRPEMAQFDKDMDFVWGEAEQIRGSYGMLGPALRILFFVMGVAILFTTELGVLDAVSRIGADIVKVNYLRENDAWPLGRIYFLFLWAMILIGCGILLAGASFPTFKQPLFLLKTAAAMNGGVMFIYCVLLLYMNSKILSRSLAITPLRFVAMIWSCAFFGYFTILALQLDIWPLIRSAALQWLQGP